jgi:hypothetical protein
MNAELINTLNATADIAIAEAQNLLLEIQEIELPNQDELYNENLMEVATDDPEENIVQEFMRISKTLTDAIMGDVEEFFMPTATELPPALQMLEHIENILERPSVKKIIQRLDKKFNQAERAIPLTAFEKVGAIGHKKCPKCPYWYKGERGLREHMTRDICSRVAVGQVLRPVDTLDIKVDDAIYWATKNLEGAMPRCILRQNILRAELEDDEYEDDDTESCTRCSVCEGKMEGLDGGSDDCYCDYCFDCGERLTDEDDKEMDGQMVCNDCYMEEEYHTVSISAEQQAKDDETANENA